MLHPWLHPGLDGLWLCLVVLDSRTRFARSQRHFSHLMSYFQFAVFPNHCIVESDKVMELDFLYPSEGIHRRWDNGYRITATAATSDQAAFVLSVPRRKPVDETQETLRTSTFPSTHVKVGLPSFWLVCQIKPNVTSII